VTESAAARLAFVLAGEGIACAFPHTMPPRCWLLVNGQGGLPEVDTAPLDIYLVHSQRIGPSARLLRDFLLDTAGDSAA